MSGHERERLSAYLDDELVPEERASVEAHLASCAECVDWLGELAAVDSRLAARAVDAPEGYFDAFPRRVRARIGASARSRSGPLLRRLPVWTWSLAAALLLAVLTPAVLREPAMAPSKAPQGSIRVALLQQGISPQTLEHGLENSRAAHLLGALKCVRGPVQASSVVAPEDKVLGNARLGLQHKTLGPDLAEAMQSFVQ